MKPLSIAIVGAGIGGLAAATLLRRAGHEVHVFEQAAQFARVGAGIQMAPNAMKVLRLLGVEEQLVNKAFQADYALSRAWDTGEPSSELPLGESVAQEFGAPYLFLHRADLHAAIASLVSSDNVHLNMKLKFFDQKASGVDLHFTNGVMIKADAVIGADGVHSLIRTQMLGPERPRFTGKVAYRTTFPASRIQGVNMAPVLGLFAFDLSGRTAALYSLSVLFLAFLLVRRLSHAPLGLALQAIRDNRLRASAVGIPVNRRLATACTLAGALAGLAGALLAQTTSFASLDVLAFHRSADVLLVLVIGGAGYLYGGLIGAALFTFMHDRLAAITPQYWQFWVGLILVLIVLVGRERITRPWTWFRRRKALTAGGTPA